MKGDLNIMAYYNTEWESYEFILTKIHSFLTIVMDIKTSTDVKQSQYIPHTIISPFRDVHDPFTVNSPAVYIGKTSMDKLAIRTNFETAYNSIIKEPTPCSFMQEWYFASLAYNYILFRKSSINDKHRYTGELLGNKIYTVINNIISSNFISDTLYNIYITDIKRNAPNNTINDIINVWIEKQFMHPLYAYGTFNNMNMDNSHTTHVYKSNKFKWV
jgi:hypothetical protein